MTTNKNSKRFISRNDEYKQTLGTLLSQASTLFSEDSAVPSVWVAVPLFRSSAAGMPIKKLPIHVSRPLAPFHFEVDSVEARFCVLCDDIVDSHDVLDVEYDEVFL